MYVQCTFTHVYMYMVSLSSLFSEPCPLFFLFFFETGSRSGLDVTYLTKMAGGRPRDPPACASPALGLNPLGLFCVSSGILTQACVPARREVVFR